MCIYIYIVNLFSQTGRGFVRDVTFANLTFHEVQNPIIIDQHYCFTSNGCPDLVIFLINLHLYAYMLYYDLIIQIRDTLNLYINYTWNI